MTTIETVELDRWVESLAQCKQLTEAEVKTLCEKVAFLVHYVGQLTRVGQGDSDGGEQRTRLNNNT